MGQQISVEDAFPVYRKRCGELFDETLVLRAQVEVLEKQLAAANERLQQAAAEPTSVAGGPDLAAQPPYPEDGRG
ncbi:HAD family hydrolase [Streptomyces mirabilis]|uniref:hypothetical protein n=1 Tax=Streptomyces mirabilis TaxID=68239 RepID=UPI00366909F9